MKQIGILRRWFARLKSSLGRTYALLFVFLAFCFIGWPGAFLGGVLGWFVFTTQAHENHLFFALPLLALALPGRPSLFWIFGLLSLSLLLNMVLHDQLVLEALGSGLEDQWVVVLRQLNALQNVLCWLGWGLARISQQDVAGQERRPHPARRRAQLQHTP